MQWYLGLLKDTFLDFFNKNVIPQNHLSELFLMWGHKICF